MALSDSTNPQGLLGSKFERRLFTRRGDLTNEIRLQIAITALYAMLTGVWGTVTGLAVEYSVSRTFIYLLATALREAGYYIFDEASVVVKGLSPRALSIQIMLSLRMEGQSSIGGISEIMKRFGHELSATGSISQIITRIGCLLPIAD